MKSRALVGLWKYFDVFIPFVGRLLRLSFIAYSDSFTVLIMTGQQAARHIAKYVATPICSACPQSQTNVCGPVNWDWAESREAPVAELRRGETLIIDPSVRLLIFTVNPPHLTFPESIHQPTIDARDS